MGVDALWHLIQTYDNIGEAESWCGQYYPGVTEDLTLANCVECLRAAAEYGNRVRARLEELESTLSPLY